MLSIKEKKRLIRSLIFTITLLSIIMLAENSSDNNGCNRFEYEELAPSYGDFLFYNFSSNNFTDTYPNTSIYVNTTDLSLINDTEGFFYSESADSELGYVNLHSDIFNDSTVNDYWEKRNEINGSISEINGTLKIIDIGDHAWGGNPGETPSYDAPAITQEAHGDFKANLTINTTLIDDSTKNGGILCILGNDLLRLSYSLSPSNSSEGIIIASSTENNLNQEHAQETLSHAQVLILSIERKENLFCFSYINGSGSYHPLFNDSFYLERSASIGIYAAHNAVLDAYQWQVSPRITSFNSENQTMIDCIEVPFSKFDDDNEIQFIVNSTNGTLTSSIYMVDIDCSNGSITFDNYIPRETEDITPDVSFYLPTNETDFNNPNIFLDSAYFAYARDGTRPNNFINPTKDFFIYDANSSSGDALPGYWRTSNPENLEYKLESSVAILNITDNNTSTWNESVNTAPAITQDICGDFTAISKFIFNSSFNSSGGIALILNSSLAYKLHITRLDNGSVVVSIIKFESGTALILTQEIISNLEDGQFWVKIDHNDKNFTFSYSLTGQTYNYYFDLLEFNLLFDEIFEVGLFVEQNGTMLVDYWDITPSISVRSQINVNYHYYINVMGIPFNQYSNDQNTLRVRITNTSFDVAYSNVVYIKTFATEMDGVHILYSDGDYVNLATYSKNIIWSYKQPQALDLEYLPNNNVLITHGLSTSGGIIEVDQSKNIVWSLYSAGGLPLDWPHDADLLLNNHVLFADTGNDRVIEVTRDGQVVWSWSAWDYFSPSQSITGRSHLNDVDRLKNGNTLVTLRDLNKIVELNPQGDVIWELSDSISSFIGEIHNADRLDNGNTIFCDSKNGRILEINSNNQILWDFFPKDDNQNQFLGWPRDVDAITSDFILVSDTRRENLGKNAIYIIRKNDGKIIWEKDTDNANYDSDIILLHEPRVNILAPLNDTIPSRTIDLFLEGSTIFDDIYYKIYDNSTNSWVNTNPVHYTGRLNVGLQDQHEFTLFTWANITGGYGGGFPQDDSNILQNGQVSRVSFSTNMSIPTNSSRSFPGTTILVSDYPPTLYEVDQNNETIWSLELPLFDDEAEVYFTYISSVDLMPNGNFLVGLNIIYYSNIISLRVLEISPLGNIAWEYHDAHIVNIYKPHGIHDADYLEESDTFLIADTYLQRVIEVNRDHEIIWIWNPDDHFTFIDDDFVLFYENGIFQNLSLLNWEDWYHLNDVDMLSNGHYLISLRDLNIIVEVNRTGDIVWYYGHPSNYALMKWQHNPVRLKNGNTIICDSSNNRVIEINSNKSIVWSTESYPGLSLLFPRGAERLPNGNTLISDSFNNRNIEITPTGKIVWEFPALMAYDADRIDRYAPYIEVKGIEKEVYYSKDFIINITIEAPDLDDAWYNVYDSEKKEWVFQNISIPFHNQINLTLDFGEYILFIWANDTAMGNLHDTSDFHGNVASVMVPFKIKQDQSQILVAIIILIALSSFGVAIVTFSIIKYKKRTQTRLNNGNYNIGYENGDRSVNEDESDELLLNL